MKLLVAMALAFMLAGCGEADSADRYSDKERPGYDFEVHFDNDSRDGSQRSVDVYVLEGANPEAVEPIANYVFVDGYKKTIVRFYAQSEEGLYSFATATYNPSLDVSFESSHPGAGAALSKTVSRDEYGSKWPFKVDSGEVDCRPGPAALFVSGDKTYQLNGLASQLGYASINPIWRDNPAIPSSKISLRPIIDKALSFCR